MTKLPLSDLVACADRELAMRERVYPVWVEKKKMSDDKAAHETAAMKQIAATLRWLEKWEPVIRSAIERHQKAMAVISGEPVAQIVLREFPDAEVTIRDTETM